jgi:unsaturated rhamnogalacturonyl hydrolase
MSKKYDNILKLANRLFTEGTPEKPAWHTKPKNHRWDYVDGCMYKAAMDLYLATNDKVYPDFVKKYVDHYVQPDGNISGYDLEEYNIDHVNGGKVLFDLHRITGEEKYRKAAELLYRQLEGHPRTKEGNFWHKEIYPYQVWLDGLYMGQPFYVEYDMLFGGKKVYGDSIKQFENTFRLLRDPETGLFYHGYDESREMFWADKETGLSPHFWSRAVGWYAMALVDTAEKLDAELTAERQTLARHLKEMLDAMLKFLSPGKMFYQVTDLGHRDGNYEETSGSLGIAYSMMKGARLGLLPAEYFDQGKEIFDATVSAKLVEKDGKPVLLDTVLVSGLGGMPGMGDYKLRDGTYEYYISEPRVENDGKGVAPLLFCMAEIIRH